ncbi:ComEC/Rec2 family competence protein [Adhaeribacter radiodurans]|uniref:ComEC family competence protein n=1 Tax=Adhaeribacter radiodurans TaxID=2745197 RepID=A0A7L7LA53_9BACT|nr:ComEC/Rec2 family competence protein [Adhaeribacter radiodurans]QMU29425.1 ComEC family competence protein [Adhaeribacter radiodurans]
MIKWSPYVFVRLTICFVAGILLQIYSNKLIDWASVLLLFFSLLFFSLHFLGARRGSDLLTSLAGIVGLASIFLFGILITQQRTEINQPRHLTHQQLPALYYTGVVNDFVVEKPHHYNVILRVNQVRNFKGWQPVTGKIMLMVRKEKGLLQPRYGDVLLIKGKPEVPLPPLNLNAFNYKQYLAYQQIYHQQYVRPQQFKVLGYQPPSPILAFSIHLRHNLDAILKKYVPEQRNYAIATALVLGMKEYLDTDIKAAYTRTGTTHVLAVSGLHVALLFLALNYILGKLARTPRQKLAVFLFLLAAMWLYAFVTALSASVLRAVVMFTLLSIGKFFRRRSNMYNILAATAFGLLVYNPFFLLDVGFQLSFAAVLGIVLWQPRLNKLIKVDNWLGGKIWEGVSASVAAQLATMPLAFYYFHQFPIYFLMANLFAITISEFILYVGFLLLTFGIIPGVGYILGWIMNFLLNIMNGVVLVIEKLPMAIIEGISLTTVQVWLLAGFLILSSWFLIYHKKIFLLGISLTIIAFSGLQWAKIVNQQKQHLWVVYTLKNNAALGFIQGKQATLLADSAVLADKIDFTYNIQPHWWHLGINEIQFVSLQTETNPTVPTFKTPAGNKVMVWQGLRILILIYPEQFHSTSGNPLLFDYVLLRNNVKLSLEILQAAVRFKSLLVDSSSKNWYRQQLQQQCAKQQIPLYDVSKQGAFICSNVN